MSYSTSPTLPPKTLQRQGRGGEDPHELLHDLKGLGVKG